MTTTVMKFGGTSVADVRAFERVAHIVGERATGRTVVVVSAMSRVTDALLSSTEMAIRGAADGAARSLEEHFERHTEVIKSLLWAYEDEARAALGGARAAISDALRLLAERPALRAPLQDLIASYGELMSSALLAAVLRETGLDARFVDARRCILTDDAHGSASPHLEESAELIRREITPLLEDRVVPVLGGFIGMSRGGATTTLGRNGSDYTAALVGAALRADEIQIWSDVTGILTADPRLVREALTVPTLSYAEAEALSHFGAKVLYPKTIQPAAAQNIPLRICNSLAPAEPGTLIGPVGGGAAKEVKSIACKTGMSVVRVRSARALGHLPFLREVFAILERHPVAIDFAAASEIGLTLLLGESATPPAAAEELRRLGAVESTPRRAVICVVGSGLATSHDVVARVFGAVADVGISFFTQSASDVHLIFVVDEERAGEVVARLHEAFFGQAVAQPATSVFATESMMPAL